MIYKHPMLFGGLMVALALSSVALEHRFGAPPARGDTAETQPGDTYRWKSETKKGFTLIVTMPRDVKAGDAAPMKVTVKSDRRTTTFPGGFVPFFDCDLRLRDLSADIQVPLTRYGQQLEQTEVLTYSGPVQRVAPDKPIAWDIKLARLFDMTVAGKYAMKMRVYVPTKEGKRVALTIDSAKLEMYATARRLRQ